MTTHRAERWQRFLLWLTHVHWYGQTQVYDEYSEGRPRTLGICSCGRWKAL